MSTNTTLGDQPLTVAMLVRLYVPYATKPKIKALNKKLKVLSSVMHNWSKINNNLPIDSMSAKRFREDENKVYEMKTLLQISTDNFDKGSRGKKHKRLMNELYKRYNIN